VDRLVLIVFGSSEIHAGEAVARRQGALHIIALGRGVFAELVQAIPVGLVAQRPRRQPGGDGFPRRVEQPEPQALLEAGFEVAHGLELGHDRRGAQECIEADRAKRLGQMFGCEQARTQRLMHALDLGHVEQAGGIADQDCAGHFQLGQALVAAGDDDARTGGKDAATLQQPLNLGVRFPLLEGFVGLVQRVGVVQAGNVAQRHPVVIQVIQKGAAVGVGVGRPADAVEDGSRFGAARGQLPQLLDAYRVALRVAVGGQIKALDQLLGQMTASALGQHRDLGLDVDAFGVARLV